MLDRTEFAKIMKLLAEAKCKRFDADQIESWYLLASMKDYPLEAWRTAIVKLSYDPGDWPTFDKLASAAAEHVQGVAETGYDALANVRRALRKYHPDIAGSERTAAQELTPAELAAVRSVGGFSRFFNCLTKDSGILTAQFRDAFEAISGRGRRQKALPEQVRPRIEFDRGLAGRVAELAGNLTLSEDD